MHKLDYPALYSKYGIAHASLADAESKRQLTVALLRRRNGSTDPQLISYVNSNYAGIEKLEELLDVLISDIHPELFDNGKTKDPLHKERLYLTINQEMHNGIDKKPSALKAARRILRQNRELDFSSAESMRNRFNYIDSSRALREILRNKSARESLRQLMQEFEGDRDAASIWSEFITGLAVMDWEAVDIALSNEHPFSVRLCLIFCPVPAGWSKLISAFDWASGGTSQTEMAYHYGLSNIQPDEMQEALIALFAQHGLAKPTKKSKSKKRRKSK